MRTYGFLSLSLFLFLCSHFFFPASSFLLKHHPNRIFFAKGYEYSRSANPNRNALEATLASLESGGAHALAFASGSATTATVLQSLGPNTHIVSVNDVYGGTFRYMTRVASETQGLETTFVDLEHADEDAIRGAIRENTKVGLLSHSFISLKTDDSQLIWVESPTNPTLRLIDIPRLAQIAHSHPSHPLLLVDNTFLSPFYASPLLLGADIVMHSITKYINGHSDVVMGALILPPLESPALTRIYEKLRFLQNAIGAVPSAYDSWLTQRGAKTLHLRMKAHGENALLVARALKASPHVEEVIYPGLEGDKRNDLAWRMLSPHAKKFIGPRKEGFPFSGMISFRIKGGFEAAEKFLTSARLFTLAESLGGVESLAEHPARMTHGSVPEKERELLGIGEGLVRLSVGVEDGEDLVRDVLQALEKAGELRAQ